MTSLTDFVGPLAKKGMQARALAMIFYAITVEKAEFVSSATLRDLIKRLRIKGSNKLNTADILGRLGNAGFLEPIYPDTRPIRWRITENGRARVRADLRLQEDAHELEAEIAELTAVATKVASDETRDFLLESVRCLRVKALRASLVFVWSGAVWTVQEWLIKNHPLKSIDAEVARHQKTRAIKGIDDFAFVNDATTLLVARDLGLWDKGQHTIVEHALDLRNQCGHPSRYTVSAARCKSVIEELVTLVFHHAG